MDLYIPTPLQHAPAYSAALGRPVRFKMEALQPTGSFKARGVGHACRTWQARGARRLVSSSGGNAGIAVAHSGRLLGVPVLVVVPESTSAPARERIRMEGAELLVHGQMWSEANDHAQSLLTPQDAFIHPFDDPLLWDGHATMIDEVAAAGIKPGAVVLSVGGGGLLCGVVEGLRRQGWHDVPVIAAETTGSACYAASLAAGAPVTLDAITSVATSLGARCPSAHAVALAEVHPIESAVVSDRDAVAACLKFLDAHRVMVEPACGAALAVLENPPPTLRAADNVLVIACGGVGVSLAQLQTWSARL